MSSRLCHDLAGAIGGAANGLQLLSGPASQDAGAPRDDTAAQLIGDCLAEAGRRLALFRAAFGAAGLDGSHSPLAEAHRLARSWLAGSRVALMWRQPGPAASESVASTADAARLALCLILLASESLRRGGIVSVRAEPSANGDLLLDVLAQGPSAELSEDRRLALAAVDTKGLSARSIDAYYAQCLTLQLGGTLVCEEKAGSRVRFTVRLPCRHA